MVKKDAYYFSHDSNARHDPNISEMRADYGSEGYGWYWIIVEMMREQADYKLKLCKSNAFAMQMQCENDTAKKFIDDCLKRYELFTTDGEYFWSESLIRRMKLKEEKSEKARQSALSRWENKDDANALQTQSKRNASKGKESKGKEITTDDADEPSCPYEKIKEMYNLKCELSKVKVMSAERKIHIKARWRQYKYNIVIFEEMFDNVSRSKFLNGDNDRKWRADFDWLMNENNMAKVIEGKYNKDETNNKVITPGSKIL